MHLIKFTFKKFLPVLFLIAGISACANITPPEAPDSSTPWQKRQATLSQIKNWNLSGKIAVITKQDSGSASIDWSQRAQRFDINLYGPVFTSGIKLNGSQGNVTMTTGSGQKYTANTPEQLLSERFGWRLPVSYMRYWIRGLPVPGLAQKNTYDKSHRLSSLRQGGFLVEFQRYTRSDGFDLPQRIIIQTNGFKSKIFVYKWQIVH